MTVCAIEPPEERCGAGFAVPTNAAHSQAKRYRCRGEIRVVFGAALILTPPQVGAARDLKMPTDEEIKSNAVQCIVSAGFVKNFIQTT